MTVHRLRSILQKNWIWYLFSLLLLLGIKYFYSRAGSDQLLWILGPTERWVRSLSGISFEYQSGLGYVNHTHRVIITSSCSGVQFMTIGAAALIFSFVHRMNSKWKGLFWTSSCFFTAYIFTVFVNGFRIVLSIYLPPILMKAGVITQQLTPEKLHTVIGTVVYFSFLILLYHLGEITSRWFANGTIRHPVGLPQRHGLPDCHGSYRRQLLWILLPSFWYIFILLGLPALRGAFWNGGAAFVEYGFLVTGICIAVILFFAGIVSVIGVVRAIMKMAGI